MVKSQDLSNVKFGLWVIMMYQCRFTDYNKCTILSVRCSEGEEVMCWGSRHRETLHLSLILLSM